MLMVTVDLNKQILTKLKTGYSHKQQNKRTKTSIIKFLLTNSPGIKNDVIEPNKSKQKYRQMHNYNINIVHTVYIM